MSEFKCVVEGCQGLRVKGPFYEIYTHSAFCEDHKCRRTECHLAPLEGKVTCEEHHLDWQIKGRVMNLARMDRIEEKKKEILRLDAEIAKKKKESVAPSKSTGENRRAHLNHGPISH